MRFHSGIAAMLVIIATASGARADDVTDEAAFRAVVAHQGIGVLVGPWRPSFAQYRVDGPSEVAAVLEELVARVAA